MKQIIAQREFKIEQVHFQPGDVVCRFETTGGVPLDHVMQSMVYGNSKSEEIVAEVDPDQPHSGEQTEPEQTTSDQPPSGESTAAAKPNNRRKR